MANNAKTQKTFEFKELFYVLKKNWIVEAILFVLICVMGFVYTKVNTDYYMAYATVVLRAEVGSSSSSYNDTVLSKMYLETISELITNNAIIERANEKYQKTDAYEANASDYISGGFVSVSFGEDSLLLNLSYRDYNPDKAKVKLDTIIEVCIDKTTSSIENVSFYDFMKAHGYDLNNPDDVAKLLEKDPSLESVLSSALDKADESWFPANIRIIKISPETTVGRASDDKKILVLALLGAVAAVGAYALLMYFVRDRVSSVDRIESITGKKNFVTIEKKKNSGKPLPICEGEAEGSHIEIDLCKLSDTLIYMSDGENNKVFQIQSAISGEGKTTVSTNLAKALGESQRKTLIIDCDFSKPSIHRIFKQHRHLGITDYFKGEKSFDDIVKATGAENVDLITCGDRISNHTIFFASPKFKAIIDEAKERYDFVILDCAPVKALSDYINISAVADATLLVVGNDKLSARDLDYTVKELEACNANLIGTVFNFSAIESRRKYYNYYYYHKKNKQ